MDDDEDVVMESDDAYAQISNALADWGDDSTSKRALSEATESLRKKSVFSKAGFVRPTFSPNAHPGSSPGGRGASRLQKFTVGGEDGGEGSDMIVAAGFAGSLTSSALVAPVDEVEKSCCALGHEALRDLLAFSKNRAPEDDGAANSNFFDALARAANCRGDEGRAERNVWTLMEKLCEEGVDNLLNVRPEEYEESTPLDAIVSDVCSTPSEVIIECVNNDRLLRRRQIILEWLESCAEEDIVFYDPNAKSRNGRAAMWPQTMKNGGGRFHVDLEELKGLDGEDEAELLSSVFMMIRAGKLQDACALCAKAGQPWRAASISGSMPMGSNVDEIGNDSGSFFGNPKFALWRR